ncbi:MAG TPA: pyridoxal phosphate-dependent aminotransferase family protein [Bacteroidota bacterium]|nr:pyridoxal phosphate-dependent aminotransferase family protein [Bacteroidota bacterium]
MSTRNSYRGGENFDLRQMLLCGRRLKLKEKTSMFSAFLDDLAAHNHFTQMRCIASAADREVTVLDSRTGEPKQMLMFGSNSYLGIANHPYVKERVHQAIREYGVGIGGPPLLNGYTKLHRELEERLAALKGAEDVMIFPAGYSANVGLVTGLVNETDMVLYDIYSHASFCDGMKMAGVGSAHFPHNNISRLKALLEAHGNEVDHELFVGVEGVYSMDGDLAPLDEIVPLCRAHNALLIVDDAHGTGVMGEHGRGTAEHFGLEGQIDITMGTFSKTFSATGGFVAASKPIINYLRFFARSYMFSASLPPPVIATVLGGLDVMEREPERLRQLWDIVNYAQSALGELGFAFRSESPILPLIVPVGMDLREAARRFHDAGLFVNSIEYPAVPISQQRFRVSLMATHTKGDIDRLVNTVGEIWSSLAPRARQDDAAVQSEAA